MGRVIDALEAAWRTFTAQKRAGTRTGGHDDWVWPTVGTYGQSQHTLGLRHNHAAMSAMAVQWVGICSTFNAVECASTPLRLYRKSGSGGMVGRWAGRRVRATKQLRWLKTSVGGPGQKAAQYAEQAGDVEEIVDSPILDLLHHPNPWDGCATYHRRLFQCLELPGNSYELWSESGDAIQLLGLLPQWTRVQPDDAKLISGYRYGREESHIAVYSPDDVLHHMHMPALDNHWYGVGPLHNILSETNIFAQAVAYELNGLINGMRPGDIAIEMGEDTTDIQVDQARAELRKRYQGARQAQTPMIFVNAKPVPLMRTNKDMEYQQGMERVQQMTMAAFGVNQELIMRSGASLIGGDNAKSDAYKTYARATLIPRLSAVCEKRNAELIPKFGIEPGEVWLAYDNPSPDDNTADIEAGVKSIPVALMTINEAREAIDLPPLEGGDELRINGVPLDKVGQQPDDPFGGSGGGSTADRDGGDKEKASSFLWTKSVKWVEKLTTKDDDLRGRPIRMTVGELEANLLNWWNGVRPTILEGVDVGTGGVSIAFTPAQTSGFVGAVVPPLSKVAVAGFNRAVAELDKVGKLPATMGKIETLSTPAADVLRSHAGKLFRSVHESLTNHIRDSIGAGIEQGETLGQLTARVKDIAGPGTENASYMIARTESARAYNVSREDGWRESGNVKYKKWVLSGNPCSLCRALAAKCQRVPVGQPMLNEGESIEHSGGTFTNDYMAIQMPPGHVNCACSGSAVFE